MTVLDLGACPNCGSKESVMQRALGASAPLLLLAPTQQPLACTRCGARWVGIRPRPGYSS